MIGWGIAWTARMTNRNSGGRWGEVLKLVQEQTFSLPPFFPEPVGFFRLISCRGCPIEFMLVRKPSRYCCRVSRSLKGFIRYPNGPDSTALFIVFHQSVRSGIYWDIKLLVNLFRSLNTVHVSLDTDIHEDKIRTFFPCDLDSFPSVKGTAYHFIPSSFRVSPASLKLLPHLHDQDTPLTHIFILPSSSLEMLS
jgi:hypothetical protein